MNPPIVSKKKQVDDEAAILAYLRDNATIVKSMVNREKNVMQKEAEMDQIKRYNDLCEKYPCTLRYFDDVPLCRDGKEGPCSECKLRQLIMD